MVSKYAIERWIGWVIIALLCLVPVLRWISLVDMPTQLSSWFGVASTLGKLGALIGTMLYALNFVLAIRAKWLEPLFGGLSRAYIAHHITGGLALIMLCFHPIFLAVRHVEVGVAKSYQLTADVLLPDPVRFSSVGDFTESMSINFGIIGFLGLVVLLVCTFFIKFSYQTWLLTHKFLGLAFLISGLHIVYVWSDVRNDLPLRLYLVFWIGIGLASFVHRSLLGNIFVRRYRYTVSRVSSPAEGVVTIGFEPLRKRLSFKAGQFVYVRFVSGELKGETHPFSLTGKQGDHDKELEISAKALGDYTTKLQKVQFGDHALIEGAFGRFIPARYPNKKQVWIAGGIGVTPFIASAKAFSSVSAEKTTLFYCVNSETEMINGNLFKELAHDDQRFKFEQFVAGGQNGFLSADYILKKVETFDDTIFFICGPPAMMKSMKKQLQENGVHAKDIIGEEFSLSRGDE